ncbi:MAG: HNH endonuclease [Sphingomonadaceae bacterium]
MGETRATVEERFWSKVQKSEDGCWVWNGTIRQTGYGTLKIGGRMVAAHRLAYDLVKGPIPEDMCVCHACDNRTCVRPDHLFIGTRADNNRDMRIKGRAARGERHGTHTHPERVPRGERAAKAKLTNRQVVEIRRLRATGEASYGSLARRYGVSHRAIKKAITGESWGHVEAA